MMMIMVVAIGMVRLLFLLFSCDDSCGRGVAHVGVSAAYRSSGCEYVCGCSGYIVARVAV